MPSTEKTQVSPAQAAINAAGSFVKQMAPVAGGAAIEQLLAVNAEKRAQERYEKNQRDMYLYGQEAQRNAAVNQVAGLKAAGLSTALASGAQGMQTAVASMPQSNPKAPAPNPQNALLGSASLMQATQAEANAAEADLKREQERGQRIANDNAEGANYTFNAGYDVALDEAIADAAAVGDTRSISFLVRLRDLNKNIIKTKGDWDALVDVLKVYQNSPRVLADRTNALFEREVGQVALQNPVIASARAFRPVLENKLLAAKFNEAMAMTAKLATDADVNKASIEKLGADIDLIASEIGKNEALQKQIIAEAEKTHNNDVITLAQQGDWKGVTLNAVKGGVTWLGETSKGVAIAATAGASGNISGALMQGAQTAKESASTIKSGAKTASSVLMNYREQQNLKTFGTKEAPHATIINGKPWTSDKSGNYHPYKARSRKR